MFIVENIVESSVQDAIEQFVTSRMFPWYFDTATIDVNELPTESDSVVVRKGLNPFQFTHVVIRDSKQNTQYFNLISPIVENLSKELKSDLQIVRAKFNFLAQDTSSIHHWPHIDLSDDDHPDLKTAIYYVNETDGDTYIFNESAPLSADSVTIDQQISPKKGKIIVFDANRFHASSSPVISKKRIVLNIVFKIL